MTPLPLISDDASASSACTCPSCDCGRIAFQAPPIDAADDELEDDEPDCGP